MALNILLTGGAGYIGAALTEKLSQHPDIARVTVFDNLSSGNYDFFFHSKWDKNKVQFIEGDILETRKIKKAVAAADVVVHLASLDSPANDQSSAHHMEQVNHWGTAELTYAIESSSVQKVIFLSTSEVYGYAEEAKNEEAELLPSTAFASSKMRAEAHVLRLKDKINSIVLRIGQVTGHGPVKNFKGVANRFLLDTITKNRLSIHGDGKQVRPIVHLDYLLTVLEKTIVGQVDSGVYNIQQANLQVLDLLEELKKSKPEVEFIFSNHHLRMPSRNVTTKFPALFGESQFDMGQIFEGMLQQAKL